MIPEFPKFKKLEFEDRKEISAYTARFHPYSDFNFWSMWSWDVNNEFQVSWLNKNLVVKFTDYITGDPFYSFLGSRRVSQTAKKLLDLSRAEGIKPELRLIPGFIAKELPLGDFHVQSDQDNFDYTLSLLKLAPKHGSKLSTRRRVINRFKDEHKPVLVPLDLSEAKNKESILKVCKDWEIQKGVSSADANHVFEAINRLVNSPDFPEIAAFGAYLEDKLIGYCINEFLPHGFVIGHFMQADKDIFSGVYAYFMQETAPVLMLGGGEFVNIEQDLGIAGLRKWKQSYSPFGFLEKYKVREHSE